MSLHSKIIQFSLCVYHIGSIHNETMAIKEKNLLNYAYGLCIIYRPHTKTIHSVAYKWPCPVHLAGRTPFSRCISALQLGLFFPGSGAQPVIWRSDQCNWKTPAARARLLLQPATRVWLFPESSKSHYTWYKIVGCGCGYLFISAYKLYNLDYSWDWT
jgi:hypothetical protein